MLNVSLIFGTRPEAIKLCPLALALRRHAWFDPHVCVTAQHRQMLDDTLDCFGVVPDVDLDIMRPGQTLAELTSRTIAAVDAYLDAQRPDLVIVQGDTTTVFSAALCAFYRKIPVAHVEAGLRTWKKDSPWPEEMNRVLTSRLADFHFAPTEWARQNLLREGVAPERVFMTGNTVIDALDIALEKTRGRPAAEIPGLPTDLPENTTETPLVLITGHRRENFGKRFESICAAISRLAERFPRATFVYPVHLNPRVREPVFRLLAGRPNVRLIEPLGYLAFVALLDRCALALTDSGGLQEEAPRLGKPVLVMRDHTERPEGVDAGTALLTGTNADSIVEHVSRLLSDKQAYDEMARAVNPYGDGQACRRIIEILEQRMDK